MNFEEYLKRQGLKAVTVYQHWQYVGHFLSWVAGEGLSLEQVSYNEILDYAAYQKQENKGVELVNRMLLAIRYYFSWLQEQGRISSNPVAGIRMKGSVRTVPNCLLEKAELDALYESYQVKDERSQRNKVMLSLLIYQGLTRQELHQLKEEDIKLKEGKVYIAANEHSNSRILQLEAFQIMELYEYIHVTRSKILANSMAAQSGQLFISMNGCEEMKNSLYHLNQALRRLNVKYKNAAQLRQSVITEWLKVKDLRMVQYMAGHKYVSSTERYQTSNLEDLKEALNKHHPLK